MKSIHVVAAVICDEAEAKHKIYATARGYGEYKGWWEFPGGKVEENETPQQALRREIGEELAVDVDVLEKIGTVEYDYPTFHLSMECFWCMIKAGEPVLKEALEASWLDRDSLHSVQWLPADRMILQEVQDEML